MTHKSSQDWLNAMAIAPVKGMSVSAETGGAAPGAGAAYVLPPLPFAQDALEPYVSAKTMSFHYGKHHQAYVDNLNKLTAGTDAAGNSLETIIREVAVSTDKAAIFNNAAQIWNHNFFWHSQISGGGGKPAGRVLQAIEKSFGSFEEFGKVFVNTGVAQFGSGWVWLVQNDNRLEVVKTANADTPLVHGQTALLVCDVWEHAYYLDYQNRRKDFIQTFIDHLANWEFAATNLK